MSETPSSQPSTEFATRSKPGSWVLLYVKGVCMGLGDSVPGVSGGTIAVITRIYDEFIDSIKSVDLGALRKLISGDVKGAWSHINGNFLALLALGILSGLLVSANTVLYLLDNQFQALMGFFIGLVLASCWLLRTEVTWQASAQGARNLYAMLAGIFVTVGVGMLPAASAEPGLAYLFLCGAIAICAMLLPGLSGAFILILLGAYEYALTALTSFDLVVILVFMSGCVVGLMLFSRLLSWLLHHYHQLSYSFIIGLLLGSLSVLWPWQRVVSYFEHSDGTREALQTANILPAQFYQATGQDAKTGLTVVCLVAGLLLVILLQKLFDHSDEEVSE